MKAIVDFPKIGYDLDGVLVPDMNYELFDSLDQYLEIRAEAIKPLFQPKGAYVIITARPCEDEIKTKYWVDKFLKNPPYAVHNEKTIYEDHVTYKSFVINLYGLQTFVESDRIQVECLRALCPDTEIIWFGDFISETLSKL